mmetsp:Transcript_41874/g.67908  ORF Transcript_41874/g.67908 Transcript_41874/m.67908 type:complete len:301 (-) Transcript_41874:75-977(-)
MMVAFVVCVSASSYGTSSPARQRIFSSSTCDALREGIFKGTTNGFFVVRQNFLCAKRLSSSRRIFETQAVSNGTSSKMGSVYIVRHGERVDFVDLKWKRNSPYPDDPHLTPLGHKQAESLAKRLADSGITQIFCSPFLRVMQTANAVAVALNAPLKIENGAMEWLDPYLFSDRPSLIYENTSLDDLQRQFPTIDPTYTSLHPFPKFPEGYDDVMQRGQATVVPIVQEYCIEKGESILFAGHGASVLALASGLLKRRVRMEPDYTSLTKLVAAAPGGDSWTAEYLFDASHIKGIEKSPLIH